MAKIMEASVNLPKDTGHTKDASHLKDAVRHVERISDQYPAEKPYDVAIKATPVTCERLPYVPHEDDPLVDAGTARVNIAPTREKPNGTTEGWWAERHADKTVVEQHTVYFDRDNDGIIWPSDTYRGFRDFGWSVPLSLFATFIINVNLSYPTLPSWLPDPRFPIYVKRMYKDKHGSDSMSFDNEGRFRPQSFEDFFAKYDRGNKGGLDKRDIWAAIKGQSMVFDLFGISATMLECMYPRCAVIVAKADCQQGQVSTCCCGQRTG